MPVRQCAWQTRPAVPDSVGASTTGVAVNTATPLPRLEKLLPPDHAKEKQQLLDGLKQSHASINPKFFYDEIGCQLFTKQYEQAEYYHSRTEAGMIQHYADQIS